jgi:glutathione S-transferase
MRLVTVGGVPSPWSEAAKAIFHVKKIPFVGVRSMPGDKSVKEWTRHRNAPVAIFDDEPARTGWADILELAERIAPEPSLVPDAHRVELFGLAHEILGENGLLWSARIFTLDTSFATDGAKGFPLPVAQYLAPRYGYAKDARVGKARLRAESLLAMLGDRLGGREYFLGDALTALDLYAATSLSLFDPLDDARCPMIDMIRQTFDTMKGELVVPPALVAHRDRIYERHLELPVTL